MNIYTYIYDKGYSISTAIKERNITITLKLYLTPIRMTVMSILNMTADEYARKCTLSTWLVQPLWKAVWQVFLHTEEGSGAGLQTTGNMTAIVSTTLNRGLIHP